MQLEQRACRPIEAVQHRVLTGAFAWMTLGLALTGVVAFATSQSPTLLNLIFGNKLVFFGLIIAELGLVFTLASAVQRLGSAAGTGLFLLFSGLNGLTLSVIFLRYTGASLASTFLVAAGMFGSVALYGFVTKRDLTSIGSFFFMGLIGIVLASVVNFFLQSEAIYWAVTYLGVAVFLGLAAWDVQKLKNLGLQISGDGEAVARASILGALALYLDFINLFLMLLRILGGRRD
jgi:FtsH-binding integral membrane protein